MERRGPGEATRKVPVRVELRKSRIGADARFARLVRTSIVRAIRNGARTFGDLLLDLPSIYPTEVLAAMDRMPMLPGVDAEVLDRIRAEAGAPPEGRAAGGSLLPLPHPLDFEWRFSADTCREMLVAASDLTREGDTILLYGTPGLAYAAISLPVRDRCVVFAGEDNAVTRRLLDLNKAAGSRIATMVGESPRRECAAAVLVDPPWYPDYLQPMLRCAAAACRRDGVVLASLPPDGIRPGAAEERDAVEQFAAIQGLDRVAFDQLAISYETPFFEENALAAAGIRVPGVWRRGDLAVYRHRRAFGDEGAVPERRRPSWAEVEIEGMRVRIRLDAATPSADPGLRSLVRGDVLPSVSRRDPRRGEANVWTSGNRIFQADNAMVALKAAYACGTGGADGASRLLWHSLVDEDAFAALVERLRRLASLEAEERARFALGGGSRIGWAA